MAKRNKEYWCQLREKSLQDAKMDLLKAANKERELYAKYKKAQSNRLIRVQIRNKLLEQKRHTLCELAETDDGMYDLRILGKLVKTKALRKEDFYELFEDNGILLWDDKPLINVFLMFDDTCSFLLDYENDDLIAKPREEAEQLGKQMIVLRE